MCNLSEGIEAEAREKEREKNIGAFVRGCKNLGCDQQSIAQQLSVGYGLPSQEAEMKVQKYWL